MQSCAPWAAAILSHTPSTPPPYPDVPPLKAEREQIVADWLTEVATFHDTWNLLCSEAMVQGTLNELAEMLPAKGASAEDVKKATLTCGSCAMPQQLLSLPARCASTLSYPLQLATQEYGGHCVECERLPAVERLRLPAAR